MAISFSGVGSGLDYSAWVDALVADKQKAVTSVEKKISAIQQEQNAVKSIKSKILSLKTSITKFTDSNLLSSYDIFTRKNITSSDDNCVSATATNSASIQNFDLKISQLASATIATGINNSGAIASASTKLTDLNNQVITKGEASIYADDRKYTFAVDENTTVEDFTDWLDGILGTDTCSINGDGTFSLNTTNSNLQFGSNADTSNIWSFFGLKESYDGEDNFIGYSSTKMLTSINTTKPLTDASSGMAASITEGTFKIGKAEFTIDSTTSLSGLIYQINSNSDAGVIASYDGVSNKLVLKAKEPGATRINVEAGTSNFTTAMGLTTAGGDIATGSQVLGDNAKFTINGQSFETASNTITEAATGLTGITLNLKKPTSGEESVVLNVETDTTEVETAIKDFCSKYNDLYSLVKSSTEFGATLYGETTLSSMLNDISNTIMNIVPGISTYISMSSVGISTGSASTASTDVPTTLVFDSTKFRTAMNNNANEVKKLFVNNDEDNTLDGVMTKLKDKIEQYTDIEKGYFSIKDTSFESQLKSLNTSLERKQNAVDAYRERLTKQFQDMDSKISEMQSMTSYISALATSAS